MTKTFVETGFLFSVLLTHIFAFLIIWLAPAFDTAAERQTLTLIIAPVTAAYFLAGVRFAIRNQARTTPSPQINKTYALTVGIVTATFLGTILVVLGGYAFSWLSVQVGDIKVVVGAVETFMGAAFALVAEDIFQEKITKA